MYSDEIDLRSIRASVHRQQNKANAKRKQKDLHTIDSFPKMKFKFPDEDPTSLKSFIVYDEIEKLKQMSGYDFFMYCFRNMLIYQCNLIFDYNFSLDYNFNVVEMSVNDFRKIFPKHIKTSTLKDCERRENSLFFEFDINYLQSLNKWYTVRYTENPDAKSRQYILFTFGVLFSAYNELSYNCKDFMLFILERYHYAKTPMIMHNLKNLMKLSNIGIAKSKQKALDRLNKYFRFLYSMNVLDSDYGGYTFTIEDYDSGIPINLKLKRIDHYYKYD